MPAVCLSASRLSAWACCLSVCQPPVSGPAVCCLPAVCLYVSRLSVCQPPVCLGLLSVCIPDVCMFASRLSVWTCCLYVCQPSVCLPVTCLPACHLSVCQPSVCLPAACLPACYLSVCQPSACLSALCLPSGRLSTYRLCPGSCLSVTQPPVCICNPHLPATCLCPPLVELPTSCLLAGHPVYQPPVYQPPVRLLAACLSAASCLATIHLTDLWLTGEPVFSGRLQLQRYRQRTPHWDVRSTARSRKPADQVNFMTGVRSVMQCFVPNFPVVSFYCKILIFDWLFERSVTELQWMMFDKRISTIRLRCLHLSSWYCIFQSLADVNIT